MLMLIIINMSRHTAHQLHIMCHTKMTGTQEDWKQWFNHSRYKHLQCQWETITLDSSVFCTNVITVQKRTALNNSQPPKELWMRRHQLTTSTKQQWRKGYCEKALCQNNKQNQLTDLADRIHKIDIEFNISAK